MAEAQLLMQALGSAVAAETEWRTATFSVENMNCGGCMSKIERVLGALPAVASSRANLSTKRVTVRFDPAVSSQAMLLQTLEDAGFTAAEFVAADSGGEEKLDREFLGCLGVAGFAAMNIMLLSVAVWSGAESMDPATRDLFHWLSALIAIRRLPMQGGPSSAGHGGVCAFFASPWIRRSRLPSYYPRR